MRSKHTLTNLNRRTQGLPVTTCDAAGRVSATTRCLRRLSSRCSTAASTRIWSRVFVHGNARPVGSLNGLGASSGRIDPMGALMSKRDRAAPIPASFPTVSADAKTRSQGRTISSDEIKGHIADVLGLSLSHSQTVQALLSRVNGAEPTQLLRDPKDESVPLTARDPCHASVPKHEETRTSSACRVLIETRDCEACRARTETRAG